MIAIFTDAAKIVIELQGKTRNALAFLFGVCATFTLPPFFIFPLIIVAYGGLFLLVNTAPSRKRALADGWWWGWGFYITGLYWFCIALMTDIGAYGWMIPFALLGVTAFIALFPAIACFIFAMVPVKGVVKRAVMFSIVWTLVEFARGHVLTGFPWNLAGNSMAFSDISIQMASVFDVYGLTFWIVLFGASFATLLHKDVAFKRALGLVISLCMLFSAGMTYGMYRLDVADHRPESERYVPDIVLRLVQPNISQHHKWDPARQMEMLHRHFMLSAQPSFKKVTHIVWPESSIPYVLREDSPLLGLIQSTIPKGTTLLTGALRSQGRGPNWKVFNSILMINAKDGIVGRYDKHKLVPFGEFLPFRSWIPEGWGTPVGSTDFSQGSGVQTVSWPGLPDMRPMICYEVIFPEWAQSLADNEDELTLLRRPQFMLNVTNDAWFGVSTGPYQHFHMARMRAAEQGVPLIRVANTGITASIDAYGRVLSEIPLGQQGVSDIQLPQPVADTTASKSKYFFLFMLIFVSILLTII